MLPVQPSSHSERRSNYKKERKEKRENLKF